VRLKLEGEWEKSYSDEMLLNEIQAQQEVWPQQNQVVWTVP
jgi:hypothetical protein